MAELVVEFLGGPFDGARRRRSSRPEAFAYVDEKLRFHHAPATGRELYQVASVREEPRERVVRYRFIGFERVRCAGCGFFVPRGHGECVLCTSRLAA